MLQVQIDQTREVVKLIESADEKPFFLYLAYAMPHLPLAVSDKFKGKSEQGMYGDVIMEIDWSVGQILKTLKKNGLEILERLPASVLCFPPSDFKNQIIPTLWYLSTSPARLVPALGYLYGLIHQRR